MKFGVQVNCYRTTWDDISRSIETMDAGRWNSLWFADHERRAERQALRDAGCTRQE